MESRKWDSSQILRVIRRYHREGRDLSYAAMCREDQALVSASNHYFGSYRLAVNAAGINYERYRRKPRWTRDRVIRSIRKAVYAKVDLNWSSVSIRRDEFGWAAKAAVRARLFGNWNVALRAAGVDPQRVALYRHWSQKQVLSELRRRRRERLPLHTKAMQLQMPGLYAAAVRQFGSYTEALKRIGVDPAGVAQRREWDPQAVVRELKQFESRHGVVSQVNLSRFDTGLLRAVRIWFGNLPAAIKAAGIRKYSIRGDREATGSVDGRGKRSGGRLLASA